MSGNLTLHFFLHTFSFIDSRPQVHSKRFHTICHCHSFFAALTPLVLQEAARGNYLTLSFLSIFGDGQFEALFLHFNF